MIRTSPFFWILFLFAGARLVSGCADSTDGSASPKKGTENILLDRYLSQMIAAPTTQSEQDQNAIVNLLIDSLWDFERTASGIYYQIQDAKVSRPGHPGLTSYIRAHYRGAFLNGKEFDNSFKRQDPISFRLAQVIAGWQEVLPMMEKGEKGTFLIPSGLAYGPQGFQNMVPPNTPLRFDIHLLDFEDDPDDGF